MILHIRTVKENYCTICNSYVQPNTYTVTYWAVYNRLLVHILNDRWSSIWIHTYEVIIECEGPILLKNWCICSFSILKLSLKERTFHGICIEKRNLYSLYIKVVHKIFRKVLVGAMNAASNNIWKSKLYIYADGQ